MLRGSLRNAWQFSIDPATLSVRWNQDEHFHEDNPVFARYGESGIAAATATMGGPKSRRLEVCFQTAVPNSIERLVEESRCFFALSGVFTPSKRVET
jgi:hypothetical protein